MSHRHSSNLKHGVCNFHFVALSVSVICCFFFRLLIILRVDLESFLLGMVTVGGATRVTGGLGSGGKGLINREVGRKGLINREAGRKGLN